VSIFCTQCGKANEATSKFCFNCGSPMVAAPGAVDPQVPSTPTPAPQASAAHAFPSAPAASPETEKITADVLKLTGVGGWLRFLVVVLMVIGPVFTVGSFSRAYSEITPLVDAYPAFGTLREMLSWFTVLTILWSVYVGYRLAKGFPNAPTVAKWYFILIPVVFIVQTFLMLNISDLPEASVDAMANGLAPEFLKALISSIIWYLYLIRSKRVRYTYPDPKTHVRCPDCSLFVFSKSAACPHCKAKLRPQ